MPIAGTANAPYFNGKYLTDFLTVLVQHGSNAGITDLNDLVPYILHYSSDEVKDLIRYMPEFDPDETGKTYSAAKTQLLLLFGQADQPPNYTESMLRDFCREHSAKSPFKNKMQIETYFKEFMKIAGPLVKQKKITTKARDYYFITGLPSTIKEWFNNQVPEPNRKRTDPPGVAVSIGILQKRFDVDSLLFEPWKDDTESRDRKVKFDIDGKRIESSTRPNTRPSTPVSTTAVPPVVATNAVEDLTKLLENLSLNLALLTSANQGQNVQANQSNQGTPAAGNNTNTGNFPRRCFICGKSGTHPLHPSRCPETKALLDASLIKFDTIRERYTMLDGNDLPRAPSGFIGGVADYIRAQVRDQAQNAARTNSISLSYSNEPVLKGDVFAVSSIGLSDYNADPVTRTGKDTNRHDPIGKQDKGKKKQVDIRDPPPHLPPTQPIPGPSRPQEAPIPSPQHPINRPEGWKESLPSNRKARDDVEMKDASRKSDKSTPSYHFTSDIQEMADPKKVLQNVLDVTVSIPLFQLIGLSPQLQKLIGEATRVRREYGTKSAEYSFHDSDDFEEDEAAHTEVITNRRRIFVQNVDRLPEFLTRYGNAISRVPEKRFFAMTTGTMTVTIGGVDFTAMIDCGSELNLASKSVPMRASLAVDFEGMKWSSRGSMADTNFPTICLFRIKSLDLTT
ncbi:hypothetical protein B0H12DRAFT_1324955 [Mycena haematopus]|nr:hypothetical protein B0H12DRAFT_1324955 [Mycena haematopus]